MQQQRPITQWMMSTSLWHSANCLSGGKVVPPEPLYNALTVKAMQIISMTVVFSSQLLPIELNWYSRREKSLTPGLHKLCYPGIRDRSTWCKFGAHGEHGDVFLFSNLGALWFLENLIRYSLHICLREVKNNLFSFKNSYLRHFSWRF